MKQSSRERLTKLRNLVNALPDRDVRMKKDMEMFERFFDNFPIPVTLWTIAKDGSVVSQRGNGVVCAKASSIDDLFECPVMASMSIEAHEKAFLGESSKFLARNEESIYYVSIVPQMSLGVVYHVSGIAWDITSNAIMLASIEKIDSLSQDFKDERKEINRLAKKALKASRLSKLIHAEGEND